MKLVERIFVALLILSVMNLYLPKITFAEQHYVYAKADITKHKPEILSAPEEDIPTIKEKKTSGWTWVILAALIGGAAAAASSGGGDDGGGDSSGSDDSGDTGDYTGIW